METRCSSFHFWIIAFLVAMPISIANAHAPLTDIPPAKSPPPQMFPAYSIPANMLLPGTFTAAPEGGGTFVVGQPIPLLLTVTNKSDTLLWINDANDERTHYELQVQRWVKPGKLKDVPLTVFGRYLLGPVPLAGLTGSKGFALFPGNWYQQNLLVSRLFDMHVPGTYVIHVGLKAEYWNGQTLGQIPALPFPVDVVKSPRGVKAPQSADDMYLWPQIIEVKNSKSQP